MEWGDMDCIKLAGDRDTWRMLVNVVINYGLRLRLRNGFLLAKRDVDQICFPAGSGRRFTCSLTGSR